MYLQFYCYSTHNTLTVKTAHEQCSKFQASKRLLQ